MENFTLVELATYHPHLLTQDKLIDLLAELDAWRELDDTPASVAERLSDAEDKVQHLDNLLDCTNHATAFQLETRYNELLRFAEVAQAYDCLSPDALGGALQALDDLRSA